MGEGDLDFDWSLFSGNESPNGVDLSGLEDMGLTGVGDLANLNFDNLDLSSIMEGVGDFDQAAPPANIAELLREVSFKGGDPYAGLTKWEDSGLNPEANSRVLQNMISAGSDFTFRDQNEGYRPNDGSDETSAEDQAKLDAKIADYSKYNQDFGGADVMKYFDEYDENMTDIMQNKGGMGSQFQKSGSDRIMVHDDGTATGINTETGETYSLDKSQVDKMVSNGQINTKDSGYVAATGGTGTTPGGSKVKETKTDTKKTDTTKTDGSKSNNGMLMALLALMALMNKGGGGSSSNAVIPSLQANRTQLPYGPASGAPAARPGAGGINYFSPTTYTPKAAGGGLMSLGAGGMSHLGGYSDGGRLLKGPGDGVSDSIPATIGGKQPARLATGEFVVPARIVSELGNGSTDAGAQRLYDMMDRVQKARRKTKNVAADTKAHKYLPA